MKALLTLMLTALCFLSLNALEIVDTNGFSHIYLNSELHKLQTEELSTTREKDGVVRNNSWQGVRFDKWLQEQNLGPFSSIRFESDDRYLVTITKAEFDTLQSWLVVAQDGVRFDGNSLRLIFPQLREMQWIRNLQRIVLENFSPIPRPEKMMLLKPFLKELKLHNDPEPFIKIKGYYFRDILAKIEENNYYQVILVTRDGLKQNLEYPLHLEGAVLQKTDEGTFNLKSPQIPGGMWIKDIIYLQSGNTALIDQGQMNSLISIAKALDWDYNSDLHFRLHYSSGEEVMAFTDALAEPQVFEGTLYFELF